MNFISLHEVFLPVRDLLKSQQWYSKHFNFELAFQELSLYLVESRELNTYTHIPFNFHTNKLNEMHERLSKSGIVVTEITEDGECFDFYDLDGNRIGMCLDQYDEPNRLEFGGTFLTVRNLMKAIEWYKKNLDYEFDFFEATGGAGVINPTLQYNPYQTIQYASISNKSFRTNWSRMNLVETPIFRSRTHKVYSILSSNLEDDYFELKSRNVKLSQIMKTKNDQRFSFYDLDGNEIEIVQKHS